LKQIWFAGVHSDVGGGYPEEESGLAKVALEWMYREAKDNDCLLDSGQIDFFLGKKQTTHKQCAPDPHAAVHNSTTGVWNLAELIPRRQWDHDTEPERMRWFGPNRYRRRTIPEGAVLHESVRERMSHQDPAYEPTNLPDSYQFGE
jgi:uncharacterized protein (DUF2235 family)